MTDLNKIEIVESLRGFPKIDWGLKAINVQEAWKKTKGEGVKIAIIDTGVNVNHKDFKDNIKSAIDMHFKTTDVTDEVGHGTAVTGLIAGKRTGVAPKSDIYIAKVLDNKGLGSMASVMDGITFAINHKVDILCMSLGTPHKLPLILEERIEEAYRNGITIVCATGNSNKQIEYPANYSNVIAVGGVDKDLKRASFSNHGRELDVVAPSTEILSTHKDGKYVKMSGTSMSSPIVAGALALVISYYKKKGETLTPKQIKEMLGKLGTKTHELGHGIIDLSKLLN